MMSAELAWKNGFAATMSHKALEALAVACETNDQRLTQGSTTTPPPLNCVKDWPCEGACGVAFSGWQSGSGDTVGEVEEYFAVKCFQADQILGEPAACRYFLNWFDDTPRAEMLPTLAAWTRGVLAERKAEEARQPVLDPTFDPFA